MSNLASAYGELCRYQDALVLQEKTLEFLRRILPENHPDIGVMRLCFVELHVQFDWVCCRHRDEQSCHHMRCPWSAPRCSGASREDS